MNIWKSRVVFRWVFFDVWILTRLALVYVIVHYQLTHVCVSTRAVSSVCVAGFVCLRIYDVNHSGFGGLFFVNSVLSTVQGVGV